MRSALDCIVVLGDQYSRKLSKMFFVTVFPLCFGGEMRKGREYSTVIYFSGFSGKKTTSKLSSS